MSSSPWLVLVTLCIATACGLDAVAREMHVAPAGDDEAAGTHAAPYRTISKAAAIAQPGDTVTVHAGTYREWVQPACGGTGEDARIVYRAAPGETVIIKGSEPITNWADQGGGVWKAVVSNTLFGDYNPFALKLSGGWLHYGNWHHRGDVYLDGEALREQKTRQAVKTTKRSWYAEAGEKTTAIWANFGAADPNKALAEINVRESIFMPARSGLKYITVDGFRLAHSAENWQPPGLEVQMGAIGPRMGKRWIIQNCTVTNARCVGIILGHAPGVDYADIDAFGDHIVRNNVVRRCGQAGIAGQKGATRCLIAGNLIEETNARKEFGGWETAAIKFHQSVDTVIRGNLIRGVYRQSHGAFGIWMDFGNQGTRITGNIVYKTQAEAIFLEMNHGPALVDNNVVIGGGVRSNSEATVFAHNLFVDCPFRMVSDVKRQSRYYKPHTRVAAARKTGVPQDDKWFNNMFVRQGLDKVKNATGYASDHNVFLQGAKPSTFGDKASATSAFVANVVCTGRPRGVTVVFSVDAAALGVKGPRVDAALVGVFPTVKQTLEDRHGKPISVDTDLNGLKRTGAMTGPLGNMTKGKNIIEWSYTRTER